MRLLICVLALSVLLIGCKKADDGISIDTVKQCRDEKTGQFVPCPK